MTSRTRTAIPRYAETARLWATRAPPIIAGSASSGNASLVPTCRTLVEVSAAAACPTCPPARRSMRTVKAVAVAPPPGTIFPTALPANCDEPTTNQLLVCNAIRLSSHRQTKLAASLTTARIAQYQVRSASDLQEENTESRLGSSRYRETPVIRTKSAGRV